MNTIEPIDTAHRRHRMFYLALAGAALALVGAMGWFGARATVGPAHAPAHAGTIRRARGHGFGGLGARALSVRVAPVENKAVPLLIRAAGQVVSAHVVHIVPQVSGTLQKVYFQEGDTVRKGQRLFRIDPTPYRLAVAQARATLARDEATLAQARWQARHLAPLARKDYVTPQEYHSAQTSVATASATVAAERAALAHARLQLGYTTLRSPITGRAGSIDVKSGNLVGADQTTLVTLRQIAPILVRLSIPQAELERARTRRHQGPVPVTIASATGTRPAPGQLVFIDNQVDASSGTVTLKARFPNRRKTLWPGQYVSVALQVRMQKNALVIPETAVQAGQHGNFVYRVAHGKAWITPVTVARQQGDDAVIVRGLKIGETVITEVPGNLRNAMPVAPVTATGVVGGASAK